MKLLSLEGLDIGFAESGKNRPLQQSINLSLNSGEVVALLGQNGVGKTTLIRTISGLHPALSGDIFYGEVNLNELTPARLSKKLALVLTEKPAGANMTVVELLALGRYPYTSWAGSLSKNDIEVIEQVMSETQINYLAEKKLNQLSDGQFQKVMIARALAQETDIIILDEPTAHLDMASKVEIMMLLRKLASKGKAILIATHDLQVSLQLSDRVWLFNFGVAVQEGVPEDLVISGAIEKALFPINHNVNLLSGTVKHVETGKEQIRLTGDREIMEWTRRALLRIGYDVAQEANLVVYCAQGIWSVASDADEKRFNSVEGLLEYLSARS